MRLTIALVALLALSTMGASSCGSSNTIGTIGTSTDTGIDHAPTVQAPAKKVRRPARARTFRGNGSTNLGTIREPTDAVIVWSYRPADPQFKFFNINDADYQITINSDAPTGRSALSAGTYRNVQVSAQGSWAITFAPR